MKAKSPTNWDVQIAGMIFQTRSRVFFKYSLRDSAASFCLMYSQNLFVLDFVRRFFSSCAQIFEVYVDEIRVRLAENQPQKQVQERLREYIL